MTHEELRAILLRPEAVRRMENALYAVGLLDALVLYADEAARTILQAQAGEQDERDAAVRALLAELTPFLEYAAAGEPSYGYYLGGDPRDFHPDPESCTTEEIAAHAAACAAWDRGERPDPGGPHQPLTSEDLLAFEMASGVAREQPPEVVGYKTVAHYGLGTTTFRDPRLTALEPLVAAVRKHYPEGK